MVSGNYFRVVLKGRLGPQEVWSCTPTYDPDLETSFDWNQSFGDTIATAIAAVPIPAGLAGGLSTAGSLDSVRLELRRGSDHELLGVSEKPKTGAAVGGTTPKMPPQTAIVASLRSQTPGASGRGRLYWPAVGLGLDATTLRLVGADVTAASTGFKTYLSAIGAAILSTGAWAPWTAMPLVVLSRTKNQTFPITNILVGNVADTQRRRRDAMPETYTATPYP
jgi:hypothetical protein